MPQQLRTILQQPPIASSVLPRMLPVDRLHPPSKLELVHGENYMVDPRRSSLALTFERAFPVTWRYSVPMSILTIIWIVITIITMTRPIIVPVLEHPKVVVPLRDPVGHRIIVAIPKPLVRFRGAA